MWEQSLSGLIKALRASKDDEARVIRQALDETKQEIRSVDPDLKAGAVLKLCYLEMLGYPDLGSASFQVIECMSSPRVHIKQIGYLAAAQSFGPHTEVAMLTTNLVKKDLASPNPATAPLLHTSSTPPPVLSLALSSLPHLLSPENSTDLTPDLVAMLNHSRPAIRRRAVLVCHTLAKQEAAARAAGQDIAPPLAGYDGADGFDGVTGGRVGGWSSQSRENVWVERFRERLRDDDAGVVGATVNVVCELAMREPEPWLEIAPELYGLLTAGNNNWMLIKIVKLFAVMTPVEPRLIKKLLPPLTNLISTTSAMSLLYECISTIISGGLFNSADGDALAASCVDRLSRFLEDADQNLRYIALVALAKLVPHYPHLVARHHDTVLGSVDDPDETIRSRALDLVEGMVDRSNLQPIVTELMRHLSPATGAAASRRAGAAKSAAAMALAGASSPAGATPSLSSASYRYQLVSLILSVCAQSTYANVPDFEWYIDTLVALTYIALSLPPSLATDVVGNSSITLGGRIADHLINACARVKAIRPYAAKKMLRLLTDETFLSNVATDTRSSGPSPSTSSSAASDVAQVLGAAAWVCGEYGSASLADLRPVISALFSAPLAAAVPPPVLAVCVHNGVKVFSRWALDLRAGWEADPAAAGMAEDLAQISKVVDAIAERMAECAASGDPELKQRAAEFSGLMAYLRQSLATFEPPPAPAQPASRAQKKDAAYSFGGEEEPNPFATSEAPKDNIPSEGAFAAAASQEAVQAVVGPPCLGLLEDLFFSYALNPVASGAQAMIAPPDDLDLDAWIAPETMASLGDELAPADDEAAGVDEYGRRRFPESSNAGHGPADVAEGPSEKKRKGKKKKIKEDKGKGREITEEDHEAVARAREERLERQKDDPYYISEARTRSPRQRTVSRDDEDVDSIPIVKLDLGTSVPNTRTPPPPRRQPPPPVIDTQGEMPAGHLLRQSRNGQPANGSSTPGSGASRTATPVPPPQPAPEREIGAGVPRKVVVKKKRKDKPVVAS